jgi:hypothetical protein
MHMLFMCIAVFDRGGVARLRTAGQSSTSTTLVGGVLACCTHVQCTAKLHALPAA